MICIVRDGEFKKYNCKTNDNKNEIRSLLLSDDFDFVVFFDKNRAYALLPHLSPVKIRVVYSHEGGGLPITEGILSVHSWTNPLLLEEELKEADPWLYLSRLGFCLKNYEKWDGQESPSALYDKLAIISRFVDEGRVLFAGSFDRGTKCGHHPRINGSKGVYARQFEMNAVASAGLEIVTADVDAKKKPLLDYLIENKCMAYLGADGNSIACYRDIESAMGAVPYLRLTAHEDYEFLVDPFRVGFISPPDTSKILDKVDEIKEAMSSGLLYRRLQKGRALARVLSKDFWFYAAMEAVVRDHDLFLSIMHMGREAIGEMTSKGRMDSRTFYD